MTNTLARMNRQRAVRLGNWTGRFIKQRGITRGGVAESDTAPTLSGISPTTGEVGTAYTVTCTGTGFVDEQTCITVGGVNQATTFVSATSLTTSYTPPSAGSKAFLVRNNGTFSTTPRTFTATEPA